MEFSEYVSSQIQVNDIVKLVRDIEAEKFDYIVKTGEEFHVSANDVDVFKTLADNFQITKRFITGFGQIDSNRKRIINQIICDLNLQNILYLDEEKSYDVWGRTRMGETSLWWKVDGNIRILSTNLTRFWDHVKSTREEI